MRRFLILLLTLACPGVAAADGLVVFAASSLKGALDPAVAAFRAETGTEVAVSYGGSSALARQVEQGAPADVVILAARAWMDELQIGQRIVSATRVDLWGNGLSLVAHDPAAAPVALDGAADLAAYLGSERLAMALVDSVPVGQYGKAALQAIGQWQVVLPQVVQTEDARAAVALVASGEVGFAIVYATDARAMTAAGQGVEIGQFAPTTHEPITYPGAVVADAQNPEGARAFLAFLGGLDTSAALAAQGYVILPR